MKTICQQNFRRNIFDRGILNHICLKESERHSQIWKGIGNVSFIHNPKNFTCRHSLAKKEMNKNKEGEKCGEITSQRASL